ncbi:MAG: helix-turn-helix transcriptional regulator [Actinomycetota bacterium]
MKAATVLREARRRAGLTQAELAAACGVKQPTISRIERGVVDPSVETLDRLLAACGESLESAPRLGIGIDRTLIHENFKRTPLQRLEYASRAARGMAKLKGHWAAR